MSKDNDDDKTKGEPLRGAWSSVEHSIVQMIGVLLATAIKIANIDEGRTRLIDLITAAFMAKFGPQMRALQDATVRLAKQLERLGRERAALAQLLLETLQWVPASKANHGRNEDEHVETKMRDWQRRHFWEAGLILFLIPFAAGASILTAQKNLMATGLPVFLDSPHLAWSMAALAPLSGFAVKTMIANIRSNRLRGLVTVLLYALTVVFVLLWVWLFAVHFSGLTPAPVTDGLFEEQTALDSGLATAFTMTTLITEVLVMTVLASRLSSIADFYSPNYWLENPEFVTLTKRLERLDAQIAETVEALEAKQADLAGYQGSLDTQIHLAVLIYDARRAQRDDDIL